MSAPTPPALVWDEPVHTGWVRIELYGDKKLAHGMVPRARAVLGLMRSGYGINDRLASSPQSGFYHRLDRIDANRYIHAISNDGYDILRIYATGVEQPQQHESESITAPEVPEDQVDIELPEPQPPTPHWPEDWVRGLAVVGGRALDDHPWSYNYLWRAPDTSLTLPVPPGAEENGFDVYCVSGNGQYIGAGMYTPDADIAAILGPDGQWEQVPIPDTFAQNWVSGFSDDGRVAVGATYNLSIGPAAWRWERGQEEAEILGGIYNTSLYPVISPNGRWIARTDGSNINWQAHVHLDGALVASLPVGVAILGISDTGVAVGCRGGSQFGQRYLTGGVAVMWDADNGVTDIGGPGSQANDITHDGTIIVGHDGYPPGGTGDAWVWTAQDGRQSLGVVAAPWAIARTHFTPSAEMLITAKLAKDPNDPSIGVLMQARRHLRLCGTRHAGSEVITATSGATYPWEADHLNEVQDGTSTVITLVPITQYGSSGWIAYDPEAWPEDGELIPLVWRTDASVTDPQPPDNYVIGTVERAAFQQQTWRQVLVFYPSAVPGGSATFTEHYTQAVLWDSRLRMYDLEGGEYAHDLALPAFWASSAPGGY